jgi:hypothetical protein
MCFVVACSSFVICTSTIYFSCIANFSLFACLNLFVTKGFVVVVVANFSLFAMAWEGILSLKVEKLSWLSCYWLFDI